MKRIIEKLSLKFFDFVYENQQKKHKKKMEKLSKKILSASFSGKKIHTSSNATLTIQEEYKKKIENRQEKISRIIKTYLGKENGVEQLFEYIKGAKTEVFKKKFAAKILSFIKEDEGFIMPQKGLKALYLNLFLKGKFNFETQEMFVLSSYNVNIYALLYQFYNWYMFKMDLDGLDKETQENFKHVFEICETSKIQTLSYEEIINLKNAINRDVEAIDFVLKFAKDNEMSKKGLEKIKQGGKINL